VCFSSCKFFSPLECVGLRRVCVCVLLFIVNVLLLLILLLLLLLLLLLFSSAPRRVLVHQQSINSSTQLRSFIIYRFQICLSSAIQKMGTCKYVIIRQMRRVDCVKRVERGIHIQQYPLLNVINVPPRMELRQLLFWS
jgi:hypothetical protein